VVKQLAAITTAELREAGLAVVGKHGHLESSQIPQLVAIALDSDVYSPAALQVPEGHYAQISAAQARFASRVRGQLDKLAAEGTVVKIGAHETLPTGYDSGNRAHYYTPAAYEAAAQKYSDELKTKIEVRSRWNAIAQRLSDGPGVAMNRQHQLSPEHWEQLLDRAGW
jgi:hypothetical protein